ncbi:cupredoxin domain-containing protein [Candidatus Nitrosocosmicus hydrocola]|uniref:cupredoxin domain-containing protein n=1 Tax=Candidatus Nitrosocosmicus hydrocola TaxID=1826872 RepID=UPI0011E5C92D|nr:plastocyanin/azurin family copper-binding protein [Candidatus Nitrosocosmicus hydrocola]
MLSFFYYIHIQQLEPSSLSFLYAQGQSSSNTVVSIPKGAANPEVDITNLSPRQWYDPREISINVNGTIKWVNNDIEPHTVTSGIGGGLNSLLTNSQGKPNGLFDSGLFSAGDSISITFNNSGTFNYFCTIHPWMEGIVQVRNISTNIPSYPVDRFENKIDDFPIYNFTDDGSVEIGLSWTPVSIMTNEPITFIMDFFEYPENSRMHLWPYNFVILQNGSEIYRTTEITQVGSSTQTFAFELPGETIIRVESAANESSFVEFGTIVYENPYNLSTEFQNVSNNSSILLSPLTLVYIVYVIIIVLPIALVVIIFLYKKKKI